MGRCSESKGKKKVIMEGETVLTPTYIRPEGGGTNQKRSQTRSRWIGLKKGAWRKPEGFTDWGHES